MRDGAALGGCARHLSLPPSTHNGKLDILCILL